jgi:hypothetical protein
MGNEDRRQRRAKRRQKNRTDFMGILQYQGSERSRHMDSTLPIRPAPASSLPPFQQKNAQIFARSEDRRAAAIHLAQKNRCEGDTPPIPRRSETLSFLSDGINPCPQGKIALGDKIIRCAQRQGCQESGNGEFSVMLDQHDRERRTIFASAKYTGMLW